MMKMWSVCLSCFVLTLGTLSAQAAESCTNPLRQEAVFPAVDGAAGEELLLIALPAELERGGIVEVVYRAGGEVLSSERLAVAAEGVGDGTPVFELLAWQPDRRRTLLAETRPVEVDLVLPGGATWRHDLAALRGESARLAEDSVAPRSVHPVSPGAVETGRIERLFAADITPQQCHDQCDQEYEWCEDGCGVAPAEDCLERCDYYYAQCRTHCDNCPTVTDTTTTEFVGESYTGFTNCLTDNFGIRYKGWYDRMQRTFKHTTTRETVGCDNSYSSEVIAVWYTTDYCWKWTAVPCSFADGDRINYCNY